MLKLGLDEESINNTNANRDTRASFMLSKENSLIEQDRIGNRVSAIRFKGFIIHSIHITCQCIGNINRFHI